MSFKKMTEYVSVYGCSSSIIAYSLYLQFSRDVHISIFSESKKRVDIDDKTHFKTIKPSTYNLSNSLQILIIADDIMKEIKTYFNISNIQ